MESDSFEAIFLIKGRGAFFSSFVDELNENSNDLFLLAIDKVLLTSLGQVESNNINDHLAWLQSNLVDYEQLIKNIVNDGSFISFTFFFPKKHGMDGILEAELCGFLHRLNSPLHLHGR